MSRPAVVVENLTKVYRIGQREQRSDTLVGAATAALKAPLRNFRNLYRLGTAGRDSDAEDTIRAVDDVSFEVRQGEVLGIIGRNGAGKSTLLKILSRVTEPTSGRIRMRGRVSSLLEVGTGFHPELTGRENVYLNGTILGMTRREIDRKFDEIVDFSGVEKFLDTPVKRYSSGMKVRLAFAVAAHLEPEILIMDEVLAVGDAQFQQKCLGRMSKVAGQGRTVLFVSHNMAAVKSLCNRSIFLKGGRVDHEGATSEVIAHYLTSARTGAWISIADWEDRITSGEGRIMEFEILDGSGTPTPRVSVGGDVGFVLHADFLDTVVNPSFGVIIHDSLGEPLLDLRSIHDGLSLGPIRGKFSIKVMVRNLGLYPGRYFLSPWITDSACRRDIDHVKLCCALDVDPAPGPHGDLKLDANWGTYWIPSTWERAQARSFLQA